MRHPMAEPSQPWRVPKLLVQSSPAPAPSSRTCCCPLSSVNYHKHTRGFTKFQHFCPNTVCQGAQLIQPTSLLNCLCVSSHLNIFLKSSLKPSTIDNCKYSVGLHLLFILSLCCDFQIIKLK